MKNHESLTVGQLIDVLDGMAPDAPILELSADADSYRGYYQHVSIEPGQGTTAKDLRDYLRTRLGTHMEGWKGGDFTFKEDCYVFVAPQGSTGPSLAGFTDEGEPITFDQGWY